MYYTANITENVCKSQNHSCPKEVLCRFKPRASCTAIRAQLQSEHACVGNYSEMPRSAFIVSHPLDKLNYWTNYRIQSALCNSKGCGPFAGSVMARTLEHAPTCAPNITSMHNTSSTSISTSWSRTPVKCTHGVLLHFNVFFSLSSILTGSECFNNSTCWDLYVPSNNQQKFYLTNVTSLDVSFAKLEKYRRYCVFVQAVNIKGPGPPSNPTCVYTAEDGKTHYPSY